MHNLKLSDRERDLLYTVCMFVGGLPKGPRGDMDQIRDKLWQMEAQEREIVKDRGTSGIALTDDWPSEEE